MGVGAFFGSLILAIKRDGNRGILLLLISGLSGVVLLVIVLIPNYAVGLITSCDFRNHRCRQKNTDPGINHENKRNLNIVVES
ncbi:MAG: hypothetical protein CM1200mP8_5180 [Chloroflexota bacterium]|nr:MAG: hypothetical protein CM1200mP8_5180 [Chloroflexota bacterium]